MINFSTLFFVCLRTNELYNGNEVNMKRSFVLCLLGRLSWFNSSANERARAPTELLSMRLNDFLFDVDRTFSLFWIISFSCVIFVLFLHEIIKALHWRKMYEKGWARFCCGQNLNSNQSKSKRMNENIYFSFIFNRCDFSSETDCINRRTVE